MENRYVFLAIRRDPTNSECSFCTHVCKKGRSSILEEGVADGTIDDVDHWCEKGCHFRSHKNCKDPLQRTFSTPTTDRKKVILYDPSSSVGKDLVLINEKTSREPVIFQQREEEKPFHLWEAV